MKTLYITDLDGTLLDENGKLSENSRKYINNAIEKGACFTLATARTFATVAEMFQGVNLTLPVVLMNGVMLYDLVNKKSVYSNGISYPSALAVLNTFMSHNLTPLIYHDKSDCLEIKFSDSCNEYQKAYINNRNHAQGKLFTYSPSLQINKEDKVIYFVTLDLYENIIDLYNELKTIENINVTFYKDNYTDCYFLEIFAGGISKATGLSEVKKFIGADKVVAFGDNLNDLDMFKAADESYAVTNACSEELKKAATGIIGPNYEDSVAQFIYNHFTENINGQII